MDTNSSVLEQYLAVECVLFNFLFIFIFDRFLIHSRKAEDTLQNWFTAGTWAEEIYAVLLLQPVLTGLFGTPGSRDQTSTELFPTQSFHLEDVW